MNRYEQFILSRKKVTIQQIMDHFLVSQTTAYKAVNSLLSQGRLKRYVHNRKRYYTSGHRPSSEPRLGGQVLFQLPELPKSRERQLRTTWE